MAFDKSEWGKPTIVLGLMTLVISLCFNIVQCRENSAAGKKADRDAAIQQVDAERAEGDQRIKDDYRDGLLQELNKVRTEIKSVGIELATDSLGTTLTDPDESDAAWKNLRWHLREMQNLLEQESRVQKDLTAFLESYK